MALAASKGVEVDDKVDIDRQPRMAVQHHGEPAYHDVTHVGRVQRREEWFENRHRRILWARRSLNQPAREFHAYPGVWLAGVRTLWCTRRLTRRPRVGLLPGDLHGEEVVEHLASRVVAGIYLGAADEEVELLHGRIHRACR